MKFFTEQKTVVDHPGNDNKEKFTYVSHKPVYERVYITSLTLLCFWYLYYGHVYLLT